MNQRSKAPPERRAEKSPVRLLKFKLAMFVLLCGMPLYGVIALGLRGGSWLAIAAYPLLSLAAFALYGYDKKQARDQGQRVPEKVLHAVEVAGGWPGALVAQQVFRHKTRKVSYQLVFWLIVAVHQLFWIDRVLLGGNFFARHFY